MSEADNFHPNKTVQRGREGLRKSMFGEGKEGGGGNEGGGERPLEPAHSHHVFSDGKGSFHSATHHADGHTEHADHSSMGEAKEHMAKQFHEDGMGEEGSEGGGEGACPECGGAGCPECGMTGKM